MSLPVLGSFQALLDLLSRDGVLHQAAPDQPAVAIPTRLGAEEGLLLMRWEPERGSVQLIQSLPVLVPPGRAGATVSALLQLNHALALPGLAMNPDDRQVTYRVLLPLLPGLLPLEEDLRRLFRAAVRNAADVLPALRAVAEQNVDPAVAVDALLRDRRLRSDEAAEA